MFEREVALPYNMEGTYTPDWAKSLKANSAYLKSIIPNSKAVHTYEGYDIWRYTESPSTRFFFVQGKGYIQYGVRVMKVSLTGVLAIKTLSQVSVYANLLHTSTLGLASHVFNSILAPEFGSVLSDQTQSDKGRRFWQLRVKEALEKGLSVQVLKVKNISATQAQVLDTGTITNVRQLDNFYTYDSNLSGDQYRFLITK